MTAHLDLNYAARLAPPDRYARPQGRRDHRSWFVTFGLGKMAGGTFTEVVVPDFADDGQPLTREAKAALVRRVAVDLYGTAWAFAYGPDEAARAIWQYEMRIREHVTVTSVELWS